MSQDAKKRRVAEAAFEKVRHLIDSETPIGIGTGSTANCFIDVLAESKIKSWEQSHHLKRPQSG